ncbi:MAG: gamma-glutamyltransferase [Elusimicrobia bacterium]|nr:MAG: gamma-glutamyltransferase [Elusimicrobiota bacterium]
MKRFSILLLAAMLGCAGAPSPAKVSKSWGISGTEALVAADHALASKAGAEILAKGGNAVDAAVATSFALAVTRPQSAGLGGGGFMLIKPAGKKAVVLDYREEAPSGSRAAAYLDDKGEVIKGKTQTGVWAVGVPGHVRGVLHALREYGSMSRADVMAPAIRLAEKGFSVDAHMQRSMRNIVSRAKKHALDKALYDEIARTFLKDGKPYEIGDILRRPQFAKTLRLIAKKGESVFYEGEIGEAIVATIQDAGGPMTKKDLAQYRVKVREPLRGMYRGYEVLGMPPPSSGGACVVQVLQVLDGYPRGSLSLPEYYAVLAEAMKHAFADRAASLGDADVHPGVKKDVAQMISTVHADTVRAAFVKGKTFPPKHYGLTALKDDHGTTHYSVMDKAGNAVAATETVNTYFGSLVLASGTGIVLNNELDDFSIRTDVANVFGLMMSKRNVIRPGQRPLSSMSPTLLLKNGEVVLAAGGSGGPRIISATLQAIVQIIEFGRLPDEAVAFGRIHHQWSPNKIYAEKRLLPEARTLLEKSGHVVVDLPETREAATQVVYRKGNRLYAACDPRKGGKPAGR